MTDGDFARAVEIVLEKEGVFSDDPADPGGVTKYGITLAALDEWFRLQGRGRAPTESDIRALTKDESVAIYHDLYWMRCACDALPWFLALPVFDCAVNQGQKTAIKLLQRALGVKDDGIFGAVTQARVRYATPDTLTEFMARRAKRYADADPATFARFGRGWLVRLFAIHRLALT